MIDAAKRASAGRVTAVVPYYAYGRSDKKDQPRVPITARLVANMIEVAGADRMLTVDLHAGQIQGFFNIPVDELTAVPMLTQYFKDREIPDLVVTSTDAGGADRARDTAVILGTSIAIGEKQRVGNLDQVKSANLIGDVKGKNALIVDEEIATGGTILSIAQALKEHGAEDIYCASTHGVLCGNAPSLLADSILKEVVLSDTLPVPDDKRNGKTRIVSVAPLLGEAIRRIHSGLSVGELFDH